MRYGRYLVVGRHFSFVYANASWFIVEDAAKIKNTDIAAELCLPPVKRESLFLSSSHWLYGWHTDRK